MSTNPDNMVIQQLNHSYTLCEALLKTPHYAKIGPEGIFAVIETSKSLGIDPRQALGGGLYYVKGKVEMSARMMNSIIRSHKHSITRDPKSDDTICILHGKRADNGDEWTESFSIQEAARAGLTGTPVWKNYQRDMLFARALSRLARQLFPDVIGNVYVEGEISLDASIRGTVTMPMPFLEQQNPFTEILDVIPAEKVSEKVTSLVAEEKKPEMKKASPAQMKLIHDCIEQKARREYTTSDNITAAMCGEFKLTGESGINAQNVTEILNWLGYVPKVRSA
jgi:hypothetical protein